MQNPDILSPETYFDLSGVSFADIFHGGEHVWEAVRRLDDYIAAQFETGKVKANYKDSNNIYIGEGTEIQEGAVILGPAIIGKNCILRSHSYIRMGALIGNECLIGHGSEVKHSIIMNNTTIPHVGVVDDSILGNNVNIAAGVVTANLRLDNTPVKIKNGTHIVETGLLKFGAAVGDGSNVGVNSVLNPGTLLGKKTVVFPLKTVKGVHPQNSVIK